MRQKKVWRYYCDHCRKAGCGKGALAKHEASCARNPDRACRMCAHGGLTQQPMLALIEASYSVEALRVAANGCPACMLAGAIQGGRDDKDEAAYVDFKAEAARFWAEVNENHGEY
jgi:hypothetical protein